MIVIRGMSVTTRARCQIDPDQVLIYSWIFNAIWLLWKQKEYFQLNILHFVKLKLRSIMGDELKNWDEFETRMKESFLAWKKRNSTFASQLAIYSFI